MLSLPAFAAAGFSIEWKDDRLVIAGDLSSTAHADILRAVAGELYPETAQDWAVAVAESTPPGWSLLTEQTLRTLALSRRGSAIVSAEEIYLQGVHDDPAAWRAAVARLEKTLLTGMRIRDELIVFDDRLSFAELCQQRFRAALTKGPVRFTLSSSELSPASYPLLDALIEVAADCPDTRVQVTGHTDSTGDEELNQALSAERAAAVVAYMSANGIAAERLSASGAGSAQPLDPTNAPAARARNRRIEFRLEQD
jgi:OmpA-OmpF porin, OOP family